MEHGDHHRLHKDTAISWVPLPLCFAALANVWAIHLADAHHDCRRRCFKIDVWMYLAYHYQPTRSQNTDVVVGSRSPADVEI
ncbi:hypothetical protein C8F04DRAFT_1068030, partial [Mycena alexandri]